MSSVTLPDELCARLPKIREVLCDWEFVVSRFEANRMRFKNSMEQLYEQLRLAARYDDGQIEIYQRRRNPNPEGIPKWLHISNKVPMQGAAYFAAIDGRGVLNRARAWLDRMEEAARNTDALSLKQMTGYRKSGQEIVRDIETLNRACAAAIQFYTAKNLGIIATWATSNKSIEGTYSVRGRALVWQERNVKLDLLPDYRQPNPELLNLLRIRHSIPSAIAA